jgi:hypothetical protein
VTPLDHRPRKEQRLEPSTTAPAPKTPSTAAQSATPKALPASWEARIAALEARLNGIQALCDSLRDVPRMLASIQHKLDLQLRSPSPSSLPSPLLRTPTAPSSGQVPTDRLSAASSSSASSASATPASTVDELSQRMEAQSSLLQRHESLFERLMDQIGSLTNTIHDTIRHGGGLVQPVAVAPVARQ